MHTAVDAKSINLPVLLRLRAPDTARTSHHTILVDDTLDRIDDRQRSAMASIEWTVVTYLLTTLGVVRDHGTGHLQLDASYV